MMMTKNADTRQRWNMKVHVPNKKLENKMQAIRIFYLAMSVYATYAITYIVLWYGYGGPS